MSIYTYLLKKVTGSVKLASQNNFLFVAPHPDDIEIGAGATVAKLTALNKNVSFVIATDGRMGSENSETVPSELAKTRRAEQLAAAKLLGVTDVTFLDFEDGGMYDEDKLAAKLTEVFAQKKPDVVFCPDPLLPTECHLDHLKVARAASSAYMTCSNPLILHGLNGSFDVASPRALAYYYTARANVFVGVKDYQKLQFDSLKLHKSQFPIAKDGADPLKNLCLYLTLRSLHLGLPRFKVKAEGFRVQTNVMCHCCAEKV